MSNKTFREIDDKFDRGEFLYSEPEEKLLTLNKGEDIGGILEGCTICPAPNGTCQAFFEIQVSGWHPEKGMEPQKLVVCPHGAKTIEDCYLAK